MVLKNAEPGIPALTRLGCSPCDLLLPTTLHRGRRNVCSGPGRGAARRWSSLTGHDGGMMPTRAFCHGRWNTTQAAVLPQRLLRRRPLAVALSGRVATTRHPQPQPSAQPLRRRHDAGATHPDGSVADGPSSRADGSRGATRQRPALARRRARAALAALAGGRITAPERCARHDVPQRRLVEARTPRGGRVACVERPLHDAPHAQRR